MTATETAPVFVVVGNVNQGKSSIVATLAEDETVPIAPRPGTTVRCGEYAFHIGERTIFRLIDTPGFQDARRALGWLQQRCTSVAERRRAVEKFVREHAAAGEFPDEVQLLRPLLEGASVLYVVDASARFQPSSEAEMEILRWTGQPGMALVNRIRERDYAAEWRPILEQFFNVVRDFNAHRAGFTERMNLFRGFREVRDEWREPMDRAIAAMEQEWTARRRRGAAAIADLLVEALSRVEKRPLAPDQDPAPLAGELERALAAAERQLEQKARLEVERIYGHQRLERREGELSLLDADLFSETSWRLFGLTRGQLATYGALWGGAVGFALDLMVGGLSGFAVTLTGAGVGLITGLFGGTQIARVWGHRSKLARTLFPGDTGRFLCIGPVTNPRFAWMLLDRALVHYRAVRDRSHARRDALDLGDPAAAASAKQGVAAGLAPAVRGRLDELLRALLKEALRGSISVELRERLTTALDDVCRELPVAGDSAD